MAATWWQPLWPGEQALHTSLTALALVALAWVQRRHPLPLGSWRRNHFDRLVHFAYGLCLAGIVVGRLGWLRTLELVVSTSAVYELFEWGIAVAPAPDLAEAYNGQQGDVWDAHKDMALALQGAIVSLLLVAARTRRRPPARAVSHIA